MYVEVGLASFGRFWTAFGVAGRGFGQGVVLLRVGLERFGWFCSVLAGLAGIFGAWRAVLIRSSRFERSVWIVLERLGGFGRDFGSWRSVLVRA